MIRSTTAPLLFALTAATFAPAAGAQSVNVDFGAAGSTPSAWYAAAGDAGVWNTVGVLPAGQRANLTSLHGTTINARIYMIGCSSMLSFNNAATGGDDEALVDDMILSFNNPVDGCVWIEGLRPGTYEVRLYGLTPNNPNLLNRMRVDNANPGPLWVGGTWPGLHQETVTYSVHTVTPTNGVIGMHAGQQSANYQSGINGIQIRQLNACPGDWNASGQATVEDVFNFLAAWFANNPTADFDGSGSIGAQDIFSFLAAWFTPC